MRLSRDYQILPQICGNDFMVLKCAPPLAVTQPQLDPYFDAIEHVVEFARTSNTFWAEALVMAKRAIHV